MEWPWWCIEDGVLSCSLSLFPKGYAWFPHVFFQAVNVLAFKSIYDSTLLKFVVSVLGGHKKGFYSVGSFEMHLNPQAVTCPLEPFPQSLDVRYHYGDDLLFDPLLSLLLGWFSVVVSPLWMLCLWLNLFCRLLRAHGGKLQACRAFLMCSISLCNACGLVKSTLALNAKVLKTLLFAMMKSLLFQCRYCSVCVLSVDSGYWDLEKTVSRKGRAPSWFGSTMVNCICGSCELMCCSNCWPWFASLMTKVSSRYLSHSWGMWDRAKDLDFKLFHKQVGNEGANRGFHGSTMDLFIILTLEEEVCVFEAKLQECYYLLYVCVGPLWEQWVLL